MKIMGKDVKPGKGSACLRSNESQVRILPGVPANSITYGSGKLLLVLVSGQVFEKSLTALFVSFVGNDGRPGRRVAPKVYTSTMNPGRIRNLPTLKSRPT